MNEETTLFLMIQIKSKTIAGIMIDTGTTLSGYLHHQLVHREQRTGIPQTACTKMEGIFVEYLWNTLYQPPGDLPLLTGSLLREFSPMVIGISTDQLQTIQDVLA